MGTALFLFLMAGALDLILWKLNPEKFVGWISRINQLPGGDWFYTGSSFIWNGERLSYNAYNYFIFALLPGLVFLLLSLSVLRSCGIPWQDIGLTWSLGKQGNGRALNLGVLSGVGLILLISGIVYLASFWGMHITYVGFDWKTYRMKGIFPGPFLEEMFFRGIVFYLLEKHFRAAIVLPVSAFYFGMIHLVGDPLWLSLLISFMGLYFGWLYLRTRSLILPALAHTAANIISSFVVMNVKL